MKEQQRETNTCMSLEMLQFDAPDTPTGLAEFAADAMEHPEWCADPDHWVWELALTFFDEDGRRKS